MFGLKSFSITETRMSGVYNAPSWVERGGSGSLNITISQWRNGKLTSSCIERRLRLGKDNYEPCCTVVFANVRY